MDHTIRERYQLVVIGAGAAGLGAAVSAFQSGLTDILLLEKEERPGGVLGQCIHSGFAGDSLELTGPEYAASLAARVKAAGIRLVTEAFVTEVSDRRVSFLRPDGRYTVAADAVILAAGCTEKHAARLGITGSRPAGVYTAGEAQRLLNVSGYDLGDDAIILGAGDIGLIVARRLALLGKRVARIVERNGCPGALPKNQLLCLREFSLPLTLNSTVTAVHGLSRIESVDVRDLTSGKTETVPCGCLILAAGLTPDDALAADEPWLIRCGNADFIHTTVEDIARSARRAGKAAADHVLHGVLPAPEPRPAVTPAPLRGDETVCLLCHRGCVMKNVGGRVEGAGCARGEAFALTDEGRRYCSAAVRVRGSGRLLPVRTDRPVTERQRGDFLSFARSAVIEPPVYRCQALFAGDGFAAIACADAP